MLWMTWRQHRLALIGFGLLFLCLSLFYFVGLQPMQARSDDANTTESALRVLPALIGMFLGVPMLTREWEQNTLRYTWTQGTTRQHWLNTKILLLGGAILVLSVMFSVGHMWWFSPEAATQGWFDIVDKGVISFPAACLFGFTLGVAAGAVLKRTVPAMAVTLVGCAGVLGVMVTVLRPNFMPPLTAPVGHVANGKSMLGPTPKGMLLDHFTQLPSGAVENTKGISELEGTLFYVYQPVERFWTFQFMEAGIFIGLAACCYALTFWLLRSRRV